MIRIHGASDDLVEVEGCEGAAEFTTIEFSGLPGAELRWRGDLTAPGGGKLRVYAVYDGCWSFAPGMAGEDVPSPPWSVTLTQGAGGLTPEARAGLVRPSPARYSMVLEIDAPEGTRLVDVWPGR